MSESTHTVDSITAQVANYGGVITLQFDPPALLADARAAADAAVAVFDRDGAR